MTVNQGLICIHKEKIHPDTKKKYSLDLIKEKNLHI